MENLYRVHDSMLLSLEYNTSEVKQVYKYSQDNFIQYVNVDSETNTDTELASTVWYSKFNNIGKKINKYWNASTNLINIEDLDVVDYKQFKAELLLQQGFAWDNIFGILFVLKDSQTNIVYKSRILLASDFNINYKNEMINGTFWASSIKFWLPDILLLEQSVSFAVEVINWEDIHNDNTILSYPNEFEALIPDMPLSDKIAVKLNWNDSLQLEIEPISILPEYTIEQILRWNFSVSEINNLSIQHSIKFPADDDGNFNEYTIANDVYPTNKITIGLPLMSKQQAQVIEVTTYFRINGLLATRYTTILYDFFGTFNRLIATYIASKNENQQLNPIEVVEKITINNEIIDTVKDLRIAQISVPTYVQLVTNKDIVIDNKNIGFTEVDFDSYLKIFDIEGKPLDNFTPILSKKTIENKYFFDISETNTYMEEGSINSLTYKVFRFSDNKLVLSGLFTK